MEQHVPNPVVQAAENWQRCPYEELPRAFNAYNKELMQSERVMTYRLSDLKALSALTADCKSREAFRFVIHLGLRSRKPRRTIPNTPDFQLFIQVLTDKEDEPNDCHPLEWVPNSQFGKRTARSTESGVNAIPGASAYLFAQAWRELPHEKLAMPFTGSIRELGRRVKSFTHSAPVSQSIRADLLGREDRTITVHLGVGLAVYDHPFAFRPVVEVSTHPDGRYKKRNHKSGLEEDSDDSFYDFSMPDPPSDHVE
jgi:hypothetical protein